MSSLAPECCNLSYVWKYCVFIGGLVMSVKRLYLFVFVLMGWSLLPNALRLFKIYCAPRIWVLGREYAD